MALSKEFNVISEAMDINIILIGIEDYYRMLEARFHFNIQS